MDRDRITTGTLLVAYMVG